MKIYRAKGKNNDYSRWTLSQFQAEMFAKKIMYKMFFHSNDMSLGDKVEIQMVDLNDNNIKDLLSNIVKPIKTWEAVINEENNKNIPPRENGYDFDNWLCFDEVVNETKTS